MLVGDFLFLLRESILIANRSCESDEYRRRRRNSISAIRKERIDEEDGKGKESASSRAFPRKKEAFPRGWKRLAVLARSADSLLRLPPTARKWRC